MSMFNLHITTPEGDNWDGDAVSVVAQGIEGYFGVMNNHAPMIAALSPGLLKVRGPEKNHYYAAGDGVLEVRLDGKVVILADYAERFDSKDEAILKAKELHEHLL